MSVFPRPLPWQIALAQHWLNEKDRFAHAWLIHGMPGVGQLEFAQAGAASLLCETPEMGLACGHCQACRWFAAGNHPDLRRLRPDAIALREGESEEEGGSKKQASKEIRVEQIRGLMPWFNMAPHRGGWRVALLYPAETLNTISANALLKILEEPPGRTVFLLVGQAPDRLLPTLVSRCRRLPLPTPARDEALSWLSQQGVDDPAARLAAAGGAPLLALQAAQEGGRPLPCWLDALLDLACQGGAPAVLADALLAQDPPVWIDAAQRLWTDLSLAANGLPLRYYPSQASAIQRLSRASNPARLARTAHWLQDQRRLAQHTLNPKFLADHAARVLLGTFGEPARAAR